MPRQDAIRSRVSAILPLYRLSRYRPTPPAGETPRQAATDASTGIAGRHARRRNSDAASTADARHGKHARRRRTQVRTVGRRAADGRPGQRGTAPADGLFARRRVDLRARRIPSAGRSRRPGRPIPPGPPRADGQRGLPGDLRPDHPLAPSLPRSPRRLRRGRRAGARMVRTDSGRGRPRRPELDLESRAARRVALTDLVHRRTAAEAPAARDPAEAARPEARSTTKEPEPGKSRHERHRPRSRALPSLPLGAEQDRSARGENP